MTPQKPVITAQGMCIYVHVFTVQKSILSKAKAKL